MKIKSPFFIGLIVLALLITGVILIGVFQKSQSLEAEKSKNTVDVVDRVDNLLNNYSFEKEFTGSSSWIIDIPNGQNIDFGFDNLITQKGKYSFNISSREKGTFYLVQKVNRIEIDKKLSLLGFIKTEDVDSARFEIELRDKDSLIIKGYSPPAKKTSDWTEYNAWVKTFLPPKKKDDSLFVFVKCTLYGSGRVWFDNIRLYSIPVNETIFDVKFNPFNK